VDGCFSSGTLVTPEIIDCHPDITSTITVNPNIIHGVTNFDLIVRVTELNLVSTNGAVIITIPRDSRWFLSDGYVPSLTILSAVPLNNSDWVYSSDLNNHIFTSSSVIPAGGTSIFGFRVTFNPGSTMGIGTLTSQVVSGAGGEIRVNNNADSESIDYFQD